jgi:xanthine dehydrogenase YagR molybdenum-binding subunit
MIGAPLRRVEGPLKVTGRATYTYEERGAGPPLYGFLVEATIGRGRITALDTSRAERAAGVRGVITHRNAPRQRQPGPDPAELSPYARAFPVLADAEIRYFAQPVALVVADTFEQARDAAGLVEAAYEATGGRFELAAELDHAYAPPTVRGWIQTESLVGDFDGGFAGAPVQIDATYTTPYEFSAPMEPHCALAAWRGDSVTVYVSTQIVADARLRIARTLGLAPSQVRVIAHYVGGGFGSKLGVHAETLLAVIAARRLGRPVKVMATRQQTFSLAGHRPAAVQRVRLGADRDGRLIAFGHDPILQVSTTSDFVEQIGSVGRALYAAPHRRSTHRIVPLDLPDPEDIRAPGEAPGLLAIEAAIDELACALDLDPVELRIRNEPARHPELGVPFSDRHLVECMREGARRFGWDRRSNRPATVRDGRWLIGQGMAAAIRPQFQTSTAVTVRLEPNGAAIVRTDMTDLGTGTYTIATQIASEALGIPVDRVRVEAGDSEFPASGGSAGSWGATNTCAALVRACHALRDQVLASLPEPERASPRDLAVLVAAGFPDGLEACGSIPGMTDDPRFTAYSLASYGAHFAEVQVDADTGEIRLRRMLGVFDAGRIFNARTARSQLIGGMIWGVGAALHEDGVVDRRTGAFVTRDLAQYLVPVHADIPAIDAILLDTYDRHANELGAKGVGELGICGAGAAIANAVYNATGVRVRSYPITLDKLLTHLPRR